MSEDPKTSTHFLVKNLNGTSDNKCTCCSSWVEHHLKHSKSTRNVCSALGCGKIFEAGAHVQIKDPEYSNKWYIALLCSTCNNPANNVEFFIKKSAYLVSARCDMCKNNPEVLIKLNEK